MREIVRSQNENQTKMEERQAEMIANQERMGQQMNAMFKFIQNNTGSIPSDLSAHFSKSSLGIDDTNMFLFKFINFIVIIIIYFDLLLQVIVDWSLNNRAASYVFCIVMKSYCILFAMVV